MLTSVNIPGGQEFLSRQEQPLAQLTRAAILNGP